MCVFYQAYEYAFQEYVKSCEEQGCRCPGHTVERTQQELRERRSLLEQQLGFPDIPALLGHKGMLSEERRAALTHDYETIQQQGYTGDGFARLDELANILVVEHSMYEVTGMTVESFTGAEKGEHEQKIVQHIQRYAKESGERTLTKKVTEVLENEQIDPGVRREIAHGFGRAAGSFRLESLVGMVKDSKHIAEVRRAAISELSTIARKHRHVEVRKAAMKALGEIAQDEQEDREVREKAIEALGRIAKNERQPQWLRRDAIAHLETLGGREAVLDLEEIARKDEVAIYVRKAATKALGAIAKNRDQSPEMRMTAIGVLEHVGGEEAMLTLREIAQNDRENVGVRMTAILALNARTMRGTQS